MEKTIQKKLNGALSLVVGSLLLFSCAANQPRTKADLEGLFEDAGKKADIVSRIRAEFVKTRVMSVFERAITVEGKLVFEKPKSFKVSLRGDLTLDIVSDGRTARIVHDYGEPVFHNIHGVEDLAANADPLLAVLDRITTGGMVAPAMTCEIKEDACIEGSFKPEETAGLSLIKLVTLRFRKDGQLERVRIDFENGNVDKTEFKSWTLLAEDDPEIIKLHHELKGLSAMEAPPTDSEILNLPQCGPISVQKTKGKQGLGDS
jgi:hypothetical protein